MARISQPDRGPAGWRWSAPIPGDTPDHSEYARLDNPHQRMQVHRNQQHPLARGLGVAKGKRAGVPVGSPDVLEHGGRPLTNSAVRAPTATTTERPRGRRVTDQVDERAEPDG
jgi:hypothetical protein